MISPIDRLIFEVVDRLVRMLSHVQRVSKRVDPGDAGLTASRKICAVVEGVLLEICSPLVDAAMLASVAPQKSAEATLAIRSLLQGCHLTFLQLLPHPGQPVELRSFLRQVVSLAEIDGLHGDMVDSLFATERLTDQAFELDPSEAFSQRARYLRRYLKESAANETYNEWRMRMIAEHGYQLDRISGDTKFISMPLVDLHNPCRWPSLTHEMGHHHAGKTAESLLLKFKEMIGDEAFTRVLHGFGKWQQFNNEKVMERTLSSWLMECYCDAFGGILLGYSSWFSQLQAFFFTEGDYLFTQRATNASYPPAFFRLRVLESVLKSRYEYVDADLHNKVSRAIGDELLLFKEIVGFIPSVDPWDKFDPVLANLAYLFVSFMRAEVATSGAKTRANIAFEQLESLVVSLDAGEPIPVASTENQSGHRRCALAEILLAGWLTRNSSHAAKVCEELIRIPSEDACSAVRRAQLIVERFDESLKRSVQVAEWVDLLKETAAPRAGAELQNGSIDSTAQDVLTEPCLLVDREIKLLLQKNALKIIPLINESQQIGANSVDVRLGHNFEIFFSNINGPLDVCDASANESTDLDSRYFEVDHLEGIVLSPGQFMLAHTLEYIRLPHNLAAQIDGRSSFARLGIQVHMTAGFVDAGFQGSLTLEIANIGAQAVKLYPGMRIGQLRFFSVSRPDKSYTELPNIKYRGLLSHNKTRQSNDAEVEVIRQARAVRDSRRVPK